MNAIAKVSLLMSICIGTTVIFLIMASFGLAAFSHIDGLMNVLCIILMNRIHENYYNKLCKIFHNKIYNFCFNYIENKRNNNNRSGTVTI